MVRDIAIVDQSDRFEFHQNGFPSIYLEYIKGFPEELYEYIKNYLADFNYNKLRPYNWHIILFRKQKKYGALKAESDLNKGLDEISAYPMKRYFASRGNKVLYSNDWLGSIGTKIFRSIPSEIRKKHFPMADFQFYTHGPFHQDLKIYLSNLIQIPRVGYVSPNKPKINVDGKTYKLAFSSHVIQQMGADLPWCINESKERFMPLWENYFGLGDFYGFLHGCVNYEIEPNLYNHEKQRDDLAITCYETCIAPEWFNWHYVSDILEEWSLDNKYYYRVGYFPIQEVDEYIVLKTLLLPGFKSTPEYKHLKKSNMKIQKEKELEGLFTLDNRLQWLIDNRDFSFIKQMHEWVPQVITTDKEMFKYPYREQI